MGIEQGGLWEKSRPPSISAGAILSARTLLPVWESKSYNQSMKPEVVREDSLYLTGLDGDEMDLPKRKKIRLVGYDYASCGAYFVTVCIADRNALLWDVGADIIRPHTPPLSQYGKIVETAIEQIPLHYETVVVDKYCIMPDHIHAIVFIIPDKNGRILSAPTISVVVGSMKRWVSKQIGFSIWQKSFLTV